MNFSRRSVRIQWYNNSVTEIQLKKARLLIKKKPYLVWYTKNYDNLSIKSIASSIINYGDWDDFQELKKIIGIKQLHDIFENIASRQRSDIKPKTKNYFNMYFAKYA